MSDLDPKDSQEIGPAGEKLQKVLARIGVGSRRDVESWISQGRIKVNGKDATLGLRVDLHDAISIDGKVIKREEAAESVRRGQRPISLPAPSCATAGAARPAAAAPPQSAWFRPRPHARTQPPAALPFPAPPQSATRAGWRTATRARASECACVTRPRPPAGEQACRPWRPRTIDMARVGRQQRWVVCRARYWGREAVALQTGALTRMAASTPSTFTAHTTQTEAPP